MIKKYHFITGVPRSGSTLLSSILKQNPRFHASISDPLATITKGIIETSQEGPGMKHEVPEERRIDIVKGVFEGFYKRIDKEIIFNTNRSWTLLTPQIDAIFPNSKFLVCVRDINWILDSFEVAHRKYPLNTNTVTGGLAGTVYSRVESLMIENGMVGFPYLGIKQAITGNEKNKLMLIEYDDLCKDPKNIIKSIYNFIDEPYFNHDFDNVENSWDEYDSEIGIPLHKVNKKVQFLPRKTILPPDILQKYKNAEIWRFL
jgi:sulfotransferase